MAKWAWDRVSWLGGEIWKYVAWLGNVIATFNFTLNTCKVSEFSTTMYFVCSDENLDCAFLAIASL